MRSELNLSFIGFAFLIDFFISVPISIIVTTVIVTKLLMMIRCRIVLDRFVVLRKIFFSVSRFIVDLLIIIVISDFLPTQGTNQSVEAQRGETAENKENRATDG